MQIRHLGPDDRAEAVAALAEAFESYPAMRHILGPTADYGRRLRRLLDFFVSARLLRGEPVLGVPGKSGALDAVALVTLPGERPSPPGLVARREALWADLGADARTRYEAHGAATGHFTVAAPHHHLNLIGVRRAQAGRGLGGLLLDAVHDLAGHDPASVGVTLNTESRANLAFYERFGYRLLGHTRVADGLETWVFFRPGPGA